MTKTLLTINQLGVGYSLDPSDSSQSTKTFCNYKPPTKAKISVSASYTKGSGLSSLIAASTIRQYRSAADAKSAFKTLTDTMKTCRRDVMEGQKLTYSVMSAPNVGNGTIGVRIDSKSATVLQNFALVGPTLVSFGGASVTGVDADTIATAFKKQVATYQHGARKS